MVLLEGTYVGIIACMDAILLLNKEKEMTSFYAVRACRNLFNEKKAGHTGTLDPNATGMMIVLLGKYTKLVPYCVSNHKKYHAEFTTGIATDTEDIWGTVINEQPTHNHTQEELNQACIPFTGDIEQIPPMYSAIKKDGKKLYEYARKGEIIERQPRKVTVNSLSVKQISENHYEMDATVSSGTYIRTLITDYCRSIGEIGVMTSLVRTGIEDLTLDQACTLEELKQGKDGHIDPYLVIDPSWKFVECKMPEMVKQGKHVYLNDEESTQVIFTYNHELLAAYEKQDDGMYHCKRGLL